MSKKTQTVRARAYRYFIKGLTVAEIGKLLDLSPRTVEGYSQADRWRENDQPIRARIVRLHEAGFKASEVAERVGLSKRTVERYLYARRENLAVTSEPVVQ